MPPRYCACLIEYLFLLAWTHTSPAILNLEVRMWTENWDEGEGVKTFELKVWIFELANHQCWSQIFFSTWVLIFTLHHSFSHILELFSVVLCKPCSSFLFACFSDSVLCIFKKILVMLPVSGLTLYQDPILHQQQRQSHASKMPYLEDVEREFDKFVLVANIIIHEAVMFTTFSRIHMYTF